MNSKFKSFLIREGFLKEGSRGVSYDYLQSVLDIFVNQSEYGTAADATFSEEELATVAQCEAGGATPEECAMKMKSAHRWQVDR